KSRSASSSSWRSSARVRQSTTTAGSASSSGSKLRCATSPQPSGRDTTQSIPPAADGRWRATNTNGETTMRILGLLKADASSEARSGPNKELIERMGAFVEEITKAGVMLGSEGLHPSSKGKRVRLAGGKFTVTDGPFTESKELVASYALFQVKTMDEAIHWTKRFLQ